MKASSRVKPRAVRNRSSYQSLLIVGRPVVPWARRARMVSYPVFHFRGVTKRFGPIDAVHRIDLSVERAETTVLIGPSGCGKSTLLRLLVGLLYPDEGRLQFEENAVTPETINALRHRMGYVIQDGGLFPHLTAKQNVLLMARQLGWQKDKREERLEDLRRMTRFPPDALTRFPAQLSGGQRQRVSLMRALMLDPDVLLMDEPLGALDPMIRAELQEQLKAIFRELQKTVVLVTHDLSEAVFLGDRIVLLRDGRIVQQGTLEDMLRTPKSEFVTEFINAQRTIFDGLHGDSVG